MSNMPDLGINVPIHNTDENEDDDDESTNIVNVHDPFFLWGIFEHKDRALIRAIGALSDADCSRLYWSCHYHKHNRVCQYVLDNNAPVCIARDAIEKISIMAKAADSKSLDLSEIPVPFLLPTSPQFIVTELRDGSIIPSKGKPLKFTVLDREGNTKVCIYKHGDELLQDAMCVAVMKEMNAIFKEENVDAEVVLYEVLPVDKSEGLIECVENAHPFIEFKKTASDNKDAISSSDALKTFIEKSPERKGNLFRTFLGFVVSGIVLQLSDRHDDNIMITEDGKILHIDFGCAFGQQTKLERLLGIFMDIPHSPFSEDVFIAMIGHESDNEIITQLWQTIKEHIWACFNAIRLHKNRFKPLGEEKFKQLYDTLMVGLNDNDARDALYIELEKCYNNRFNSARAFYYKIQQNIVS
ncbi:unnamed protein product [Adineta steineri]|uniref:PI3K/PI4K catalytic domain-containing protein n=1 Tax=Adineta steineri TaxID=433720 RepID=A0A813UGZ5_9BILA|nr:unnamed protein product [Adineta steineri]CAF0869086.1 unnamed protein product [Adineta steineri]